MRMKGEIEVTDDTEQGNKWRVRGRERIGIEMQVMTM